MHVHIMALAGVWLYASHPVPLQVRPTLFNHLLLAVCLSGWCVSTALVLAMVYVIAACKELNCQTF